MPGPAPASGSCQSCGDCPAAAQRSSTAVVCRLSGQHAGAAAVRPEPAGSPDVLQGQLFSLPETGGGTGETSQTLPQTGVKTRASLFVGKLVHLPAQVVTALGRVWHPEHFVCTECETELGNRNFFEKDGRPYCEADYFSLFSPHCAHCNKPILNVRSSHHLCHVADLV